MWNGKGKYRMREERPRANHEGCETGVERGSRHSSASVHHGAKHARKRSLFTSSKIERGHPEQEPSRKQPVVKQPTETAQPAPAAPLSQQPAAVPLRPMAPAPEAAAPQVQSEPSDVPEETRVPEMEKTKTEAEEIPELQLEEPVETEEEHRPRRRRWKHHREYTRLFPSFQAFLDQVLSLKFLCEVFLQKMKTLFVVGVCFTLFFMCVLTASKSFTASTIMSLNYEESLTGKTPNGARFSESEFLTQEYLEAVLEATGLQDDLTTSELADCLSITPTTSKLVTKEDDYYISSSYNLRVELPWSLWGKITVQDFLDEICRVYLKRFTADYRTNATSLDISFDYSDMDYEEIGSYFQMMIERINNYLTVRNDQAGSYLSSSGQSYSAVKKQVQNLQSYTLGKYQSYIWENGVAKDNARCIDDLNELNRTMRWDEMSDSQKSDIFMNILDNYNNKMVSSVLIPTYDDEGSFYMSRTKIGIDDLAIQANDLLSSAVEARKSISTNDSKIAALQEETTGQERQTAQAMVDVITQQLNDIVSATRALDADCYAQRISSYLVFSDPQISFMGRYNVKMSVMLAALVCILWYLAAIVQEGSRRQRNRLMAENK